MVASFSPATTFWPSITYTSERVPAAAGYTSARSPAATLPDADTVTPRSVWETVATLTSGPLPRERMKKNPAAPATTTSTTTARMILALLDTCSSFD